MTFQTKAEEDRFYEGVDQADYYEKEVNGVRTVYSTFVKKDAATLHQMTE